MIIQILGLLCALVGVAIFSATKAYKIGWKNGYARARGIATYQNETWMESEWEHRNEDWGKWLPPHSM